jgi:hypothetical protein
VLPSLAPPNTMASTDQARLSAALQANAPSTSTTTTTTTTPPPPIGELPAYFALDEQRTVLIYNLARRRVTRPDIVSLLSGCTVAVSAEFESLIRFVHTDGGGISALVEVSQSFFYDLFRGFVSQLVDFFCHSLVLRRM